MNTAEVGSEHIQYGGFWRRLAAMVLDLIFVGAVVVPLCNWGAARTFRFTLYWAIGHSFLFSFYSIYLVRRFGGTPGKLILRLRIQKVDGNPIGYREVLLREAPFYLLWLPSAVALIQASFQVTDPTFLSLSFGEQCKYLQMLASPWARAPDVASQVWAWSEFVVLLTNTKRRALHDFIAGTVVVVREAKERQQLQSSTATSA